MIIFFNLFLHLFIVDSESAGVYASFLQRAKVSFSDTKPIANIVLDMFGFTIRILHTFIRVLWMKKTYIPMLRVSGKLTYSYYG